MPLKILRIHILFLLAILLPKSELKFTANYLENYIIDDIEKRLFKENVIINKEEMTLFADEAIYTPYLNEVILEGNVKMFDNKDSLYCNRLILYDEEYKRFQAFNNVRFLKGLQKIQCEALHYITLSDSNDVLIEFFDKASIMDSLKIVSGDSIYVNYADSIIEDIKIRSNAKFINYRSAKYDQYMQFHPIEDNMTSKKMFINFENGNVKNMYLSGMSTTKFNVLEDSLIMGVNYSSGDSIALDIEENLINRLQIFGGVRGEFNPEKNNSRIDSIVVYNANYIDYQVNNEISYLYDDATVFYDSNELKAGEIFVDWKENILEARIKEDIYPSINGFGESPIYGSQMNFDLVTKRGTILKGNTELNDSYYRGKTIYKEENEFYYMNNSIFTTCNLEDPHYFFHSNNMKMIPNDRVIARPMIFYIQELPLFYFPFAILPNKNGHRISGWIMPSFGHSSSRGTYLDDFGYYYVPNEYSDYKILIDIQDKRGILTNHHYRYKRKSGEILV